MKYLTYVFRNVWRHPARSLLTITSTGICLFLMMILVSFFAVSDEVNFAARIYNRIITLNANGFAGTIPISYVKEVAQFDGVVAVSPLNWYGGKYQDEIMPFAQLGVDPTKIFTIFDEFTVPVHALDQFEHNKNGCVIGRKLAEDKRLKVGDSLPLKGDLYPVNLDLTICGIYDGPTNRDLRMCFFNWEYLDEGLKRIELRTSSSHAPASTRDSGNAGMICTKCKTAGLMPVLCKKIDNLYRNSESPTRTQTEEAFGKMFDEMLGDLKGMIHAIGLAVVFSLLCVAGNAMALSMRERTSELAVLKAIGFSRGLILFMVLSEATLVAGVGGMLGTMGCKALCELLDLSQFTAGLLPFFYIPWSVALEGLAVSLFVGFASGLFPAIRAVNLPVVDGLRKVI
jgi:putative ABC transport system permease protein